MDPSDKRIEKTTVQSLEKQLADVGRELHDNIMQVLVTAKLFLETGMKEPEPKKHEILDKGFGYLNQVIFETRILSQKLVPPAWGEINLKDRIKELVTQLNETSKIDVVLYTAGFHDELVSDELKLNIYRIVQEQIHNIIRHSQAKSVYIRLSSNNNFLFLLIRDDGVGFNPGRKSKGIGLQNIASRVAMHNGSLRIDSQMGAGCSVEVRIPFGMGNPPTP